MAKTIIKDEGVETPEVEVNETQEVETVQTAPASTEKPKEAKAASVKKVKIHAIEQIDCIVANVPYHLAKDKAHLVPTDVAAILVNSRKAYRI